MPPLLRRRSVLVLVLGLTLAFLLPGCGRDDESNIVRMAYLPMVATLPIFVAREQGYFKAEGVEAEFIAFANSNDMVNALIAKEIDLLPAVSSVPLLHLEAQHPGVIRLFSHTRMTADNSIDSLVVPKDSAIKALTDLEGKKIGVFPGTSARRLLSVFLKNRGVNTSDITFVPLPPPTQLGSLASGVIDALFSYEPITTIATAKQGCREVFSSVYCALLDRIPVGASAISRAFERKHPELASKAVAAIDKAVVWIRANPADAKKLLDRFTKIPPAIAAQVTLVDVTLSSEVDAASLNAFAELLRKAEEMTKGLDTEKLVAPTEPK